MPDSNLADTDVLTSTFYNTYIREQVVVTCTSATRPTGVEGRLIFETDTERLLIYDGSSWRIHFEPAQTWSPTLTATSSNPTLGSGSAVQGYYIRSGYMVTAWCRIVFGSSGVAGGSGSYIVDLPVAGATITGSTSNGLGQAIGSGFATDSGATSANEAFTVQFRSASAVQFITGTGGAVTEASPFTWAANDVLTFQVTYPIA